MTNLPRNWYSRLPTIAVAAGIPVAWLVYKHVSWMKTPEAKARMLTQQLIFWTAVALDVVLLHQVVLKRSVFKTLPQAGRWALLGVAGLLPVAAFSGSVPLVRALWPPKIVPEPRPWMSPPPVPMMQAYRPPAFTPLPQMQPLWR